MTGFWLFMFVMVLLTPLFMIAFGSYFKRSAPKQINAIFGYRTTRSMKNRDTWEFAHHRCGKIWLSAGMVLAIITVAAMAFSWGKSIDYIGRHGALLMIAQIPVLLLSIIPVELALKQTFDEQGRRKL